MDPLDVSIVRAMGLRPYERTPKPLDALTPARIARSIGASLNTVKERIARMNESGVLAGYNAFVNLRHLGLRAEAYHLRFANDAAKDAALAELLRVEGLLEIHDFLGQGVCVDFCFRDEEERKRKLEIFAALAGGAAPRRFYVREMPVTERPLSSLDWRILAALRAAPREGAAELAARVGVSARTVKRHLSRMASEGSVFLVPIVDPSKADGLFLFELLVYLRAGSGPRPMSALRQEFRDEHVYAYVPASADLGHFDLLLFARTSAEVEAMRRRAEALDGVDRAEAWFFRAFRDESAWLDREIASRCEAPPTAPSPA
ncbi:MAG TPA: Lrp/AsnC family transcriptional regulator [Candidatus Thermoplasmatota archaeon]|nr:Lrp/AsnC family transcriptional regulator [Candidatus Thermoplasmatota archaeon]